MTDVRAKRRLRALEAAGVLRYQWPPGTDGQDDVEETAARLWRAREETSWEALQLRLETSFAAIEAEHTRQWRRVLGRQKARSQGLQAAHEGEPTRIPLRLRRLEWWLRLRAAGGGGPPDGQSRPQGRSRDLGRVDRGPRAQARTAVGGSRRASRTAAGSRGRHPGPADGRQRGAGPAWTSQLISALISARPS